VTTPARPEQPDPRFTTRVTSSWKQRVAEAFTQRLALKGTAALLTILLWLVVTVKEPTEDLVDVVFEPQLDSAVVLKDPAPRVRALVAGTRQELLKLTGRPLLITRPIAAGTSPDTVVVDIRPSDVSIPAGVGIVVRDVEPRSLTLRFERTSSRRVAVRSAVRISADTLVPRFDVPTVRLEPESVQVIGPRQRVSEVEYVTTVRAFIMASDSLPHLVDIDTTRLGLRVRPAQVKVQLTPSGSRASAWLPGTRF
jgi:hypothetical protein